MNVELRHGVHPFAGGQVAEGVEALEWAQVAEVEDGAEVNVEAFGPLAGKHGPAAR